MPKHVSFETPIDWRQWKLDRAIRSLRMWVDADNDLYAVPVVVVDPTAFEGNAGIANAGNVQRARWSVQYPIASATQYYFTPFGAATGPWTLYGFEISVNTAVKAVAGPVLVYIADLCDGAQNFIYYGEVWCPTASAAGYDRIQMTLPVPWRSRGNLDGTPSALICGIGVSVTAGSYKVQVWGI